LPVILSDAVALEQIFSNLLDNAIKYLEPSRKGSIAISFEILSDEITFSVRDNGRGIEGPDRHKVFEIFRRARNVGDERGLGMGLAYVKTTLRKMGGVIWFESGIESGTVFYFRLPLKLAQHQSQPEKAAA
jgi:signal transduction histidine kinase